MKNVLVLLLLNIVILSIGRCGGPLISRLYFIHGGQRIWLSSWLQTVGCPIILIPLAIAYFQRYKIDPKIILITRREFLGAAGVGILSGLNGYFNSWGPAKLPVSTSSLINATQLAFTALFVVLLVKQKLNLYSALSVALLIAAATILTLRTTNDDLPAGESAMDYMMGFFMSLIGSVLYGLILPLVEMIYLKAKKAITYTTVLEIQMIIAIFATAFCTVGMIINKDFQAIPEEARQYEIGEAKYYLVLVCCAIFWQFSLLGIVGVIFYSSSLLSGIIGAFLLPITEVLAVILFHENFQVEKGIAIFLAIWGFISYFYGENEQSKKEKQKKLDEGQSQAFLLQQELSV